MKFDAKAFRFTPLADVTDTIPVPIALAGPSGSGKTFSALLLARGLAAGGRFAILDTEGKRGIHHRQRFPECEWCPMPAHVGGEVVGYPPERWIAAIDAAEAMGLKVLVIDSFSHAWSGIGGLLEIQAEILAGMTGADASIRAWGKAKPRWRMLIDRIVRADLSVILCHRAKKVIRGKDGKPLGKVKTRRPEMDWDIVGDEELVYEMACAFMMAPDAQGVPSVLKCADEFKPVFLTGRPITEDCGRKMAEWATGADTGAARKAALDSLREHARQGTEHFRAHWRALSPDTRAVAGSIKDELQKLAAEADARASSDPWALTPEEAERLRLEAQAETDREVG